MTHVAATVRRTQHTVYQLLIPGMSFVSARLWASGNNYGVYNTFGSTAIQSVTQSAAAAASYGLCSVRIAVPAFELSQFAGTSNSIRSAAPFATFVGESKWMAQ
jgi:hypothetical protein